MNAKQLWTAYIKTLSERDRRNAFDMLEDMCAGRAASCVEDAVEYILLLDTGEVASMPDVSKWA